MAVVNLIGSRVMTGLEATPVVLGEGGEAGGSPRTWIETVETTASDSISSTYLLARLPSNARILGISKISWDDLATAGAPILDIGVFNQTGNTDITDDPDALSASTIAVATAGSAQLIDEIANYGLPLWDFVASQTVDPKVELDIKATLTDAALTAAGAGTVTVEIIYTTD